MTPKSLLRHPLATSNTEELANGKFLPFIEDEAVKEPKKVNKWILCSGKVYYDLLKYRDDHQIKNVAINRLEQIYPFADMEIQESLKKFTSVKEVVWCQEEPHNMGAWFFVAPRISQLLQDGQNLRYNGRQASASPAAGQKKVHEAEQERLLQNAFA